MAGFLNIGSVNTFATGSSVGNPVGTWTLGDKDFTYLSSTGTWTGVEDIQLTTNFNPLIFSSQFLVTNLDLTTPRRRSRSGTRFTSTVPQALAGCSKTRG